MAGQEKAIKACEECSAWGYLCKGRNKPAEHKKEKAQDKVKSVPTQKGGETYGHREKKDNMWSMSRRMCS